MWVRMPCCVYTIRLQWLTDVLINAPLPNPPPARRRRGPGDLYPGGSTVCGIAGFFYKDTGSQGPLGRTLVDMCQEMYRRGTDSVGFALYGIPREHGYVMRVQLDDGAQPGQDEAVVAAARELVSVSDVRFVGANVRLEIDSDADGGLADAIEAAVPGSRVFSFGGSMGGI